MQAFPFLKYFILFTIFGSNFLRKDGGIFCISILHGVDGSLLEIRSKGSRDNAIIDGGGGGETAEDVIGLHGVNFSPERIGFSSESNFSKISNKNVLSSNEIIAAAESFRRKLREREEHEKNHQNLEFEEEGAEVEKMLVMMELTTTLSIYNSNFFNEIDKESRPGHIPTTTLIHEDGSSGGGGGGGGGSTNDSSEEVFMSSQNETDHSGWMSQLGWADVALVTLFCSIIAGTVAGNMLVIAAVITTRRLRTVTNCFVMSLAVADWLVGMFVMPPKVFLYLVDNEWRFGRIICELWISLDILLCTASILSLCAISIDRYLAITRPLAYSRRRRSKRLALSMISCVWIAAVVITSPPIFGWYEENRNTDNKCEYNENTGYVVYSALGSFFLPLLVMLYVYARIACVITRRQRSIQKLHARGDRKSQYCGSDAEEPLHQKDRDDEGGKGDKQLHHRPTTRLSSGEGGGSLTEGDNNRTLSPPPLVLTHNQQNHQNRFSDKQTPQTDRHLQENSTGGRFLGRFGLSSCTSANNEDRVDDNVSRQNNQDKGHVANPTLALPDPATLASASSGTENSSSSATDQDGASECQNSLSNLQTHHHRPNSACCVGATTPNPRHPHHYVSRMKTGSRLCHHSIATTSPQKNIHRVHQASSSSGRTFGDDEIHVKNDTSCRSLDRSPRVWTVETTSPSPSTGKIKGKEVSKVTSTKCRSCSYEHELREACGGAMEKSPTQMESVMMECSPAGNPASLMSAASASAGNSVVGMSPSPHIDKRSPYPNRIQPNRIYQPHHGPPNSHHHHNSRLLSSNPLENPTHSTPAVSTPLTGMQRVRSMKFSPHIHTNDQNHNGGTAGRDFSSGRIASFKRETKTAQTLAAVVGGFIICWLPFFVAYVMGPFTPSASSVPSGLMDALIWLGWSNSAINPFIYAFYSADFRSAFWRLTVHKCSAILRNRNHLRNSPRRYEDPPVPAQLPATTQQHRTSA